MLHCAGCTGAVAAPTRWHELSDLNAAAALRVDPGVRRQRHASCNRQAYWHRDQHCGCGGAKRYSVHVSEDDTGDDTRRLDDNGLERGALLSSGCSTWGCWMASSAASPRARVGSGVVGVPLSHWLWRAGRSDCGGTAFAPATTTGTWLCRATFCDRRVNKQAVAYCCNSFVVKIPPLHWTCRVCTWGGHSVTTCTGCGCLDTEMERPGMV